MPLIQPQKPPLLPSFYEGSTIEIAKNLLGTFFVHHAKEGLTIGRIVETEAYLSNDPACHASRGETSRTKPMFRKPGTNYIYFIYGMYYCYNVVTAPAGTGEAVLIRALEPVAGIDLMEDRRNRGRKNPRPIPLNQLCGGPAKLVIAMGITPSMNDTDLFTGPFQIHPADSLGERFPRVAKKDIIATTRIGINVAQELPLRFYIKGNVFISKK